jgi:pimeloyl-ACP methyl ester carboxylesterase
MEKTLMTKGLRSITVTAIIALALPRAIDPVRAESLLAQRSNSTVEVLVDGAGPLVLMIPSLGRGAEDFEDLSGAVVKAGYRVARLQPRGIGRSTGTMEGVSLLDLTDDAAAGIEAASGGPAVVLGHAFGQHVASMIATTHPSMVSAVVLLAVLASKPLPPEPAVLAALRDVFDESLSPARHLEAVRVVFFAPANDPSVWRGGWYVKTAIMQGAAYATAANDATSIDEWRVAGIDFPPAVASGKVPVLLIQGLQDRITPPEHARLLKAEAPDRTELIELDGAGHAMLPEKPAEISGAVTAFLRKVAGPSR